MSEGSPNVRCDSSISDGLREAELARGLKGIFIFLRMASMDSVISLIIHSIPSIFKVCVAAPSEESKDADGGDVSITEAAEGKAP